MCGGGARSFACCVGEFVCEGLQACGVVLRGWCLEVLEALEVLGLPVVVLCLRLKALGEGVASLGVVL